MAWVYCRSSGQFRPLRKGSRALNQTSKATGMSRINDFGPAHNPANPRTIKRTVVPIDCHKLFPRVVVFIKAPNLNSPMLFAVNSFPHFFPIAPVLCRNLPVHLFLIALEANARHAQANHGECDQDLPMHQDGLV